MLTAAMRFVRRFLRVILVVICSAITVPVLVAAVIMGSFLFLPLPAVIPAPRTIAQSLPTHVRLVTGEEIAEFKDVDLNIPVDQSDIPDVLKKSVVAAEDRNFFHHGGVDIRGSARAFWADVHGGKVTQGGSTITQQYVKNTYTDKKRTLVRKVREAILASQLERTMPKEEILFKYLSTVYFGDQAYGIGAAAQTYFRKSVKDLTLSESAMLAGLIPAPSRWAPRENLVEAEFHRNLVLNQMLDQHVITQEEHDKAAAQHLYLVGSSPQQPAVATLVYPVQQTAARYPDFVDYVYRYVVAKYGPDTVLRGGLDITVTLDPRLQDAANDAVHNMLDPPNQPKAAAPDDLEMSLVSLEPQTGYVRALVGGRSFGTGTYASVNFALGGCPDKSRFDPKKIVVAATCWDGTTITGGGGGRQAGSSFKPFTLATAFAKGVPPTKVYPAVASYVPPNCRTSCTPIENAADGEGYGQPMTLREATAQSVNTVFAQLQHDVGGTDTVKDIAEMAKKLGITSTFDVSGNQGASYTLGVDSFSPIDMASAYGVFDNHGLRAEPTPVLTVKDSTGKVLEDNSKPTTKQVIDAVVADNVTDVLRGPVSPGGTAYPNADIGRPAAGKTGTTDNYVDAWFVGYTPTLSTSVWMGYAKDDSRSMRNIRGVGTVFGGTIPAKVWHDYMVPATQGVPPTDFQEPAPIVPLSSVPDYNRQARNGIDPGTRRGASDTPAGGPYVVTPPDPEAVAPPTTTTVPPPTTTSTIPGPTNSTTTSSTLLPRR